MKILLTCHLFNLFIVIIILLCIKLFKFTVLYYINQTNCFTDLYCCISCALLTYSITAIPCWVWNLVPLFTNT